MTGLECDNDDDDDNKLYFCYLLSNSRIQRCNTFVTRLNSSKNTHFFSTHRPVCDKLNLISGEGISTGNSKIFNYRKLVSFLNDCWISERSLGLFISQTNPVFFKCSLVATVKSTYSLLWTGSYGIETLQNLLNYHCLWWKAGLTIFPSFSKEINRNAICSTV